MYMRDLYRGLPFFGLILALGSLIGCNLPTAATAIPVNPQLVPATVTGPNVPSPSPKPPKKGNRPTVAATPYSPASPKIYFSVGPDLPLDYPKNLPIIPDEHTSFLPPASGSDSYLVFAANMEIAQRIGGPVVLQTKDLKKFTFATGYTSPVMTAPYSITTCKSSFDPEFDLNYGGPGSVVSDPTRPAGNLIMIYEAENHCPGAVWQHYFYATVGFARSSDNGRTWPKPVDSELGGPDRYPVLKGSTDEPTTAEATPINMGDALPSAFLDKNFLYVTYLFAGPQGDGRIRMARARLGGSGQIKFQKWYNGAFSQPGIGGLDSAVLPTDACSSENMAQVSYNNSLIRYMLTFVCKLKSDAAAWYFSTATSLDRQDWTVPQLIQNSQFPMTGKCGVNNDAGNLFDGWYPSFMSPGSEAGHLSKTGFVFFMNGCDAGKRTFISRAFTINEP